MTELEDILGYRFQNKALLRQALTHSSCSGDIKKNYERLEFLGDRVLGVAMAHLLYFTFQNDPEGSLSPRLVELVRKETVAEVARELSLNLYIRSNPKILSENENVLCDVLEAVIGSICIEAGFETAISFVDRHFKQHIEKNALPQRDHKTILQEMIHKIKPINPTYEMIKKEGTEHEPLFYIKVVAEGLGTAVGCGKNKKAAEQAAANELIQILEARYGK